MIGLDLDLRTSTSETEHSRERELNDTIHIILQETGHSLPISQYLVPGTAQIIIKTPQLRYNSAHRYSSDCEWLGTITFHLNCLTVISISFTVPK